MRRVAVWANPVRPVDSWALGQLLHAVGLPFRLVDRPEDAGDEPLIGYGDLPPGPTRIAIPRRDEGHLPWQAAVDGGPALDEAIGSATLPVDVVARIAWLLGDEGGRSIGPEGRDEHGRARFDAARGAIGSAAEVPEVDRIVAATARWIERHLRLKGIVRWPEGVRLAVGLSHDVDHPDRYPTVRALARQPLAIRRAPRTLAIRVREELRDFLERPRRGSFWAFDRLVEAEASRGFRSTYFFASTPFHGPWGTTYDVGYDVADRRFRRIFGLIAETGGDVGLHTGYLAYADPGRILRERRRLEDAARLEIAGNRHHYWHLGPDEGATLRAHEAAGFRYDSSIAFNDHVGFRRGTSLPFEPFDPVENRSLRTRQLPVFAMDGNLFYRSSDVDAAVAGIDAGLTAIEAANGLAILNWHLQASVPTQSLYRPWAEAYLRILDLLRSRSGLWVTDLGSIDAWLTKRETTLRDAESG